MSAQTFPGLMRTADALRPDCLLLTEPLARHRLRRWGIVALLAMLALLVLALAQAMLAGQADGRSVEINLPPAMPLDLLQATSGEQAAKTVAGERAQVINAALPFVSGPIEAARPFTLASASLPTRSRALHCLTQAVYYEAGFEPVEGRRAVAQVVLNRVRHPAFPNSVCGVVYDGSSRRGCQFSFTCDGSLRRAPSPTAWAAAERVAREALRGEIAPTVGLATHYHANYVAPYWAPRLTKLQQIGAHIFYRWPGAWGRGGAFSSRYAGVETIVQPVSAGPGAVAELAAAPPDPTDRRAPEDVGGRLDVTKGWSLSIPSPQESRGRLAGVLDRQAIERGEAVYASGAQ